MRSAFTGSDRPSAGAAGRHLPQCSGGCRAAGTANGQAGVPMPAAQHGILLLADYTRTLCKESGAEALGWCAGLAGRCLVLAAVFPLLEEVCQRIWGLAG